jgi:hypothetical protein
MMNKIPPPPKPRGKRWEPKSPLGKAIFIVLMVVVIAGKCHRVYDQTHHQSEGFIPVASADAPDLSSFVGTWQAHEEHLNVAANGQGNETFNDRSTCPDAPAAGCGITGTVDFTLTSVSGDTATGTITAASNPKHPIGGPVTIKLVGGGQGLQLTVAGGDQGFPFCNSNDASHYYCGA